jgi:hypothetical protein
MTYRDSIYFLTLLSSACVTGKAVGDLEDTDGSGTADDGGESGGDTEPDPSAGDTGVPGLCLEEPFECTSDGFCQGDACGVTDHWDENGCPRPSCGASNECPAGLSCFHFADWNLDSSSGWGCELFDGECQCGETADGNADVSHCVPPEIMPPPVERCVPASPGGGAFSIDPPLGDTGGTAQCTVLAVDPLQLECTGDFTGTFTITLASSAAHNLAVDQAVTLEFHAQAQVEWLDQWLRILSDDGATVSVVAVQASALLPSDATDPFWPTNVELEVGDIGCIGYFCGEGGQTVIGRSIRVGQGDEAIDVAGGESADVPGKFGGELPVITVHEARDGACGITLGDQPGMYSFVIVQALR